MRACLCAVIALALTGATAAPSVAQPDNKAAAKAHFDSAEAHFRAGEYHEAIAGYASSHKLFPAPILLFNIGLCHERLGEKPQAIEQYRAYLAAEPRGPRAGEAKTRIETLEKLIAAEETTAAEKRRAEIAEKRAAVDRLRADQKHAELATELASLHELTGDGELLFEIAAAREAAGQRVEAIAAYDRYLSTEKPTRADEARRRRDALARPVIGPEPPPPGGATGATQGAGGADTGASRPSIIAPIVASGATISALAVGSFFGLRSAGAEDDLEILLDEGIPPLDSSDPRLDDGKRDAVIANVAFGAALAGAAISGYLWYRFVRRSRPPARAAARLTAAPHQVALEVSW